MKESEMKTERWVCDECGSECRVEIDYTDNDYTEALENNTRFRARGVCVAKETRPDWRAVAANKGKIEGSR